MYAVYHGPEGLTRIARRTHRLAAILAAALGKAGVNVGPDFFDTLHVTGVDADAIHAKAKAARINLRAIDGSSLAISLDETTTRADVVALASLFGADASDIDALDAAAADAIPAGLKRSPASAGTARPRCLRGPGRRGWRPAAAARRRCLRARAAA